MEDINDKLLSFINLDKKADVKPVIDKVVAFYKGNIDLQITREAYSRFVRNIQPIDHDTAKPYGQIYLSSHTLIEPALIHEVLHLSMPLHHRIYTLGFEKTNPRLNDLTSLIQNILEHDIFISNYLSLGYSKDQFLENPSLNVDYKKRIKEGGVDHIYWMHEYLRLFINLSHIAPDKIDACRKGMTKMREIAIKQYPHLQDNFKEIRAWVESKNFHRNDQHFIELQRLFKIFSLPVPVKYLTHDENFLLRTVYA